MKGRLMAIPARRRSFASIHAIYDIEDGIPANGERNICAAFCVKSNSGRDASRGRLTVLQGGCAQLLRRCRTQSRYFQQTLPEER
jgi:hypothetical protein